jgi:hypothetical protein
MLVGNFGLKICWNYLWSWGVWELIGGSLRWNVWSIMDFSRISSIFPQFTSNFLQFSEELLEFS